MKRFTILLVSGLSAVLMTCEDDPTGPEVKTIPYAEYIWFDTSRYAAALGGMEPYLDGDYVIGEPFIDNNGNGVYDDGIDGFIRSNDSLLNQDLNHNGHHDGPDDPYTPEIPYDDINGDGQYGGRNFRYDAGEPFFDIDGNGEWTAPVSEVESYAQIVGLRMLGDTLDLYRSDSLYTFTSDSGITFPQLSREDCGCWDSNRNRYLSAWGAGVVLELTDTGLICTDELFSNLLKLTVVSGGVLKEGNFEDSAVVELSGFAGVISFTGTVSFSDTLTMGGDTIFPVVSIRAAAFAPADMRYVELFEPVYYKFYFTKERGLVGVQKRAHYSSDERCSAFYPRYDSIPIPLTRSGR